LRIFFGKELDPQALHHSRIASIIQPGRS